MWQSKEWRYKSIRGMERARRRKLSFLYKNIHRYQMNEIFMDNGYCIEYRPLRVVYTFRG